MVKSVDFALRDSAGAVVYGAVSGDEAGDFIEVGSGQDISLNLRKSAILKYQHLGGDLVVTLADGRTITLRGFFDAAEGQENTLMISADGQIEQVAFEDTGDGVLFANYGAPEVTGAKWSPNDRLAFLDGDEIMAPVVDEPTGMAAFAPAMLAGLGGGGAAAAGLAGAALLGLNGGGSSGSQEIRPTVNDPDAHSTLTTNTQNPRAVVSGTGEPGSSVTVTIGDQSQQTEIGEDGTWQVIFEGDTLPADGTYDSTVEVTSPGGTDYILDGPDFVIDMTPPDVALTEGAHSTGDVENLAEYADGITVSGNSEPGAAITVEVRGQLQSTTVAADGSWSVTFSQDQLPGGTYSAEMAVTATDALGNVTVLSDRLDVDTEPHPISFDTVAGNDVINFTEQQGGVSVSGQSTPGAQMVISLGGTELHTLTDANGTWSVSFTAAQIGSGTRDLTFTATTTDAAGNVSTESHLVQLDTEVTGLSHMTPTPDAIVADGIVNAAEAAGGLVVTGTVEAGSAVMVRLGSGQWLQASVSGTSWSVTIPAGQLPTSEVQGMALTVSATDANGNTAVQQSLVDFDPVVRNFAISASVTGDDTINATEAAEGFAISGSVEPGATVQVVFANGVSRTLVAGADGQWAASFSGADLPGAEGTMSYQVIATDAVGNATTSAGSFTYDLTAPDAPEIIGFTRDEGALLGLRTDHSDAPLEFSAVDASGTVTTVALDGDPSVRSTYTSYDFQSPVPNGSYLVVSESDAADNEAATLLVVDNTSAVTVDLSRSGLDEFDFAQIDLNFAPEAELTITEAQITALTGPDDTLVINGDSNDHVTVLGAQDTGQDTLVDGEVMSIYTIGDATLVIDDDITNVTI